MLVNPAPMQSSFPGNARHRGNEAEVWSEITVHEANYRKRFCLRSLFLPLCSAVECDEGELRLGVSSCCLRLSAGELSAAVARVKLENSRRSRAPYRTSTVLYVSDARSSSGQKLRLTYPDAFRHAHRYISYLLAELTTFYSSFGVLKPCSMQGRCTVPYRTVRVLVAVVTCVD